MVTCLEQPTKRHVRSYADRAVTPKRRGWPATAVPGAGSERFRGNVSTQLPCAGHCFARYRDGRMYCVSERTGGSPIVIVGGGVAGGNAAATLREEGFAGPVVLISQEPGVPFGRPPLSKTYLRSEEDLAGWYVRPAGWYQEQDVELFNESAVLAVDAALHTVQLDSGQELGYQKLLIATGGRNRRLPVAGAELPGIHYLRTVAEC